VQPIEICNLDAQSHAAVSLETAEYTANADAIGTPRLLEAIRRPGVEVHTPVYQAGTAEMFGWLREIPRKETTLLCPRSPYGVANLYAYWTTVNHRESDGLCAVNGILFKHESPARGDTIVSRKIARGLARVHAGLDECLYLGNLDARCGWSHARDYVKA
jgi:GDPmannose 4,6-dehydratase